MLRGDSRTTAEAVARKLGSDEVVAIGCDGRREAVAPEAGKLPRGSRSTNVSWDPTLRAVGHRTGRPWHTTCTSAPLVLSEFTETHRVELVAPTQAKAIASRAPRITEAEVESGPRQPAPV
jgi:hypothetical protein